MPFRIPRPVTSRLGKTVGLVSMGLVSGHTPKRVKLYKRIDQSPLFYLEKKQRWTLTTAVKAWPKYRIISRIKPRFEVAYSNDLELLREREWKYCTIQLEQLMPQNLRDKDMRKWLIAHFRQLAIEVDHAKVNDEGDAVVEEFSEARNVEDPFAIVSDIDEEAYERHQYPSDEEDSDLPDTYLNRFRGRSAMQRRVNMQLRQSSYDESFRVAEESAEPRGAPGLARTLPALQETPHTRVLSIKELAFFTLLFNLIACALWTAKAPTTYFFIGIANMVVVYLMQNFNSSLKTVGPGMLLPTSGNQVTQEGAQQLRARISFLEEQIRVFETKNKEGFERWYLPKRTLDRIKVTRREGDAGAASVLPADDFSSLMPGAPDSAADTLRQRKRSEQ